MSTNWKLVSKVGIPLAGLLALSACGGGGDGSSAIPPTTVSGTAAKGLVKQAKVLVCRVVNGAPEADGTCASGTTGADGSFSVTMSDGYTGAAMIKVMEVMAGTVTVSKMLDETTGTDIDYKMTMRAMVPAVAAATTVHVTPFSEMAASAVGTSAIDADRIREAMATVQTLMTGLGVDLAVKPMMDLKNNGADSAMLGEQANMVRQLTRVMMAAKNASSLKDSNGAACNAAGTSAPQQVACTVNVMASMMTNVATVDQTKSATVLAALNSQSVTAAYMPMIKADGTLATELADMTSSQSMQTAMQSAGMTTPTAANTVNIMMQGMH